ncbi:MAG: T9SS type A sorting domain-containing protein [Ignavibacteriales bacterium]|nr:T9SS type A sorting domain-containing protein [Ignavibacteriales bacterium]
MRTQLCSWRVILITLMLCGILSSANVFAQSDIWVTAYYGGWSQGWFNNGILPAQDIDYSAVTHIIHFGLVPKSNGTIDSDANSIRQSNSSELISRAHAAGKKVIISVGGWGTDVSFRGATSILNLPSFVENLANFMSSRGYDGIDIDWEVLELTDLLQYTLFIKQLRARLDRISPRPLLTAAVNWQPGIFASLLNEFDQINIMTYDMSGAWPGWVSWHNAPVLSSGLKFPSNGRLLPSAESMVDEFIAAGIPAKKIGIGIDFYGYIWSGGTGTPTGGVTGPRQSWTSPPSIQVNVPYYTLMNNYYQPQYYRWDTLAQAAYLSIDNPGSADDKFITYDNEMSCQKKVEYARNKGIGGVFIWELGGGQLPASYTSRDRLLQSIKTAVLATGVAPSAPIGTSPPTNIVGVSTNPIIAWTPSSASSWYHLQIATDTSFASPVLDQSWIVANSFKPTGLSNNTLYYWRVAATNMIGTSDWSSPVMFTTIAKQSLPAQWAYIANTGSNASVTIPAAVIPVIGKSTLLNGDAIGVFFRGNGADVCAGYGVWQGGKDLTITVWGNDPQTSTKDGLDEGDMLQFKIWRVQNQRDYSADVAYETGERLFTKGGSYTIKKFISSMNIKHMIALSKGDNLVSSFVEPTDPAIQNIFAGIKPHVLAVRDGAGGIFKPDSNINTIGKWDIHRAYQVYMNTADVLTIEGPEIAPDSTSITITPGWNFIPYLRSSSMPIDSALMNVSSSLVIVKNSTGNVYWPAVNINTIGSMQPGSGYQIFMNGSSTVNINTIGSMQPGSGYQIFMNGSSTLLYPPNAVPAINGASLPNTMRVTSSISDSHYSESPQDGNSGTNATLLVESAELQNGDEVRVKTPSMQVGVGSVSNGKALVTVWGDNKLTIITEGAHEGDPLTLTVWSREQNRERPLIISSVIDGLRGEALPPALSYQTNAVWIAKTYNLPTVLTLEQNYPNPFNASTTIKYALPLDAMVRLDVYDLTGRIVRTLVNTVQKAGAYQVSFESRSLSSGVYFYRLTARREGDIPSFFSNSGTRSDVTKKLIIIK